jgi:DnaJ-class molecular chaperone
VKSLYETLEVSVHASSVVIKAAYRCLAQRHHPDKNPDSQEAGHRLTHINGAYAVLSDPVKRQEYDLQQGIGRNVSERRGTGALLSSTREVHPNSRPFGFRPLG